MKNRILVYFVILFLCQSSEGVLAQGTFSGGLQVNAKYFQRDTLRSAAGTPQYDNQLTGGEAWLNLNYNISGFDFAVRFDMFQNSNLPDPQNSYTGQGLGYWHIKKQVNKLGITVGHFYDQIGSGAIMRSYESRPLAIDNSLVGLRLTYDLNEDWQLKAFAGRLRDPFGGKGVITGAYRPIIKGFNADGFLQLGMVSLAPGLGIVNRTIDDESMDLLVSELETYPLDYIFTPKYNAYAGSFYNTLTAGDFSLYTEVALKSREAVRLPEGQSVQDSTGNTYTIQYFDRIGSMLYATASYSRKGFGLSLQAKRTENFGYRVSPNLSNVQSLINFLPPMTRENSKRLTTRYNAATQDLGELAFQAELLFKIGKTNTVLNFSNITDLDNNQLYREALLEAKYRNRKWSFLGGLQFQQYNQLVYEGKGNTNLMSFVPYMEYSRKFKDRKKSFRMEAQYQYTEDDFGQWLFVLAELNLAPHWSFSASDMWNVVPKKTADKLHYPTVSVTYARKANRFMLSYVKQVEGIVCTGGICRFEPAFSGVQFTVDSTF